MHMHAGAGGNEHMRGTPLALMGTSQHAAAIAHAKNVGVRGGGGTPRKRHSNAMRHVEIADMIVRARHHQMLQQQQQQQQMQHMQQMNVMRGGQHGMANMNMQPGMGQVHATVASQHQHTMLHNVNLYPRLASQGCASGPPGAGMPAQGAPSILGPAAVSSPAQMSNSRPHGAAMPAQVGNTLLSGNNNMGSLGSNTAMHPLGGSAPSSAMVQGMSCWPHAQHHLSNHRPIILAPVQTPGPSGTLSSQMAAMAPRPHTIKDADNLLKASSGGGAQAGSSIPPTVIDLTDDNDNSPPASTRAGGAGKSSEPTASA